MPHIEHKFVNVRVQNEKRQNQDLYKDLLWQLSSFGNTRIAGHKDLFKPENKAALDRAVKDQLMRAASIPDRRGCGHLVLPGTAESTLLATQLARILEQGPEEVAKYDFTFKRLDDIEIYQGSVRKYQGSLGFITAIEERVPSEAVDLATTIAKLEEKIVALQKQLNAMQSGQGAGVLSNFRLDNT